MKTQPPILSPDILERARTGDAEAHAELYAAFGRMVFTLARRMLVSTALAEDVLQDTFVEVIRKARSFRGDADVVFWIRRIAINKCLSHLRSSWVVQRTDVGDDDGLLGAGPEDRPDRAVELERALAVLPSPARAVVLLHDIEGYTHKEIGRMLGKSTSYSKSQLARAYDRLRTMLNVDELDAGGRRNAPSAEPDEDETLGDELCATALKTY